ncbi:hypothetical protein V2J09_020821 [Rumex salicifolius]
MAETVVLPFAKIILGQLTPLAIKELKLALGLEDEVDRIKSNLSSIQAVLRDAEKQQTTSESIKNWLSNLHDVMYDIDDLLDDITTEIKLHKMNEGHWSKQVRNFFSRTNSLFLRFQWAHQIKSLCKKLDRIAEERKNFVLSTESVDFEDYRFRETHSKLNKPELILGREDDKEAIINSVLSCMDCDGLSVVPVVGIGGVGKTTLAQMKYMLVLDDLWNEDSNEWKNLRELLNVGAKGSTVVVTTRNKSVASIVDTVDGYILKELSPETCLEIFKRIAFKDGERIDASLLNLATRVVEKSCGLPLLVTTLGGLLRGKDEKEWCRVVHELEQGHDGILNILKLSYDQLSSSCKACFRSLSSIAKGACAQPTFVILTFWMALGFIQSDDEGEDDGRKCIAELLSNYLCMEEVGPDAAFIPDMAREFYLHDLVQDLAISMVREERVVISSSTYEVSNKTRYSFCFLSNGLDSNWILDSGATDHITPHLSFLDNPNTVSKPTSMTLPNGHKSMIKHCGNISLNSTLQLSNILHVPDFCFNLVSISKLSKDLNANVIFTPTSCLLQASSMKKPLLIGKEDKGLYLFEQAKKTRLLAIINPELLSKPFLETFISSLPYLRMLFLGNCDFENLPRTIGYMKHFRYISLEGNMRIRYLPNSICNLINLQTLVLIGCINLQELPTDIGRLENLKLLFVTTQQNCEELDFVQGLWLLEGLSRLQVLVIGGLPKFQKLPKDVQDLPLSSLKHLSIGKCEVEEDDVIEIKFEASITRACARSIPKATQ